MVYLLDIIISGIAALMLFNSPGADKGRQDASTPRPPETVGLLYEFRQLVVVPDSFKIRASDLRDIDAGGVLVELKDGRVIRRKQSDGAKDEFVPEILPKGLLSITEAGRRIPDRRLGRKRYVDGRTHCSFIGMNVSYFSPPRKTLAVYDCSRGKLLKGVIVELSADGVRFPEPLARFEGRPVLMSVGVSPHPEIYRPILVATENSAGQLALLYGTWFIDKRTLE